MLQLAEGRQDEKYKEKFEVSWTYCISTDGGHVTCRRPCIDMHKVYKQDEDGDTLLHIAVITLRPDLAIYFIDSTACSAWLNIRNNLSQSPLHIAVLTNQVSVTRKLVVAGADIEAHDRFGNNAIHLACTEGYVDVLRALLEPVSFEEQTLNNYETPFHVLNQTRSLDSANYDGLSCLHLAATKGHFEIVQMLLDKGADVNVKAEKSGRTILHEAAWQGNSALVKFLISLENFCDINAKTYDDYTAFDLARSRGHWDIVCELAKAGVKYDYEDTHQ